VRVIALYNIKGGVGKTTSCVNLAYLSATARRRTLLWDLDAQAAATYIRRVKPNVKGGGEALVRAIRPLEDAIKASDYDNLDLLPADWTYRHLDLLLGQEKKPTRRLSQLLEPLTADYDDVFLDCPPSMSLLSENVLRAADVVLVPLLPTTLSVRTMNQLREFVTESSGRAPKVRGFFSMSDGRKSLHREIIAALPKQRDDVLVNTIPNLSIVEQMAVRREPVPAFAPHSVATLADRQLWDATLA
jgi:cellulose biosynthesis protein BcsQ